MRDKIRCFCRITKSNGFTLVELLVVISIIALLMSILMPALSKARDQAKKVICQTRMKQIGIAFNLYLADNSGKLPSNPWVTGGTAQELPWFAKLGPYYQRDGLYTGTSSDTLTNYKLLRCTTQDKWTKLAKQGVQNVAMGGTKQVGWEGIYGYNYFFAEVASEGPKRAWSWRKITSIKSTGTFPLLADASADDPLGLGNEGSSGVWLRYNNPHPLAFKYGWMGKNIRTRRYNYFGPAPNHNGSCNFLMADFHVESRGICKAGAWPWLGDTPIEQQSGRAFHPRRSVGLNP